MSNGENAVEASTTTSYRIILMDLQMAVMDDFEATRILSGRRRNSDDLKNPFIAILTAHAIEDFQQQAEEVRGDAFISKPFKVETLSKISIANNQILPNVDMFAAHYM
jgi:CheY-like chemotaxis protein